MTTRILLSVCGLTHSGHFMYNRWHLSQFIHIVAWIRSPLFLIAKQYSVVRIYRILFTHSLVHTRSGCFHLLLLWIMLLSICIRHLFGCLSSSLGSTPRRANAGSGGNSMFPFLRDHRFSTELFFNYSFFIKTHHSALLPGSEGPDTIPALARIPTWTSKASMTIPIIQMERNRHREGEKMPRVTQPSGGRPEIDRVFQLESLVLPPSHPSS